MYIILICNTIYLSHKYIWFKILEILTVPYYTVCDRLKSLPYLASVAIKPLLREGEDVSLMQAYTFQHILIYRLWFVSLADH